MATATDFRRIALSMPGADESSHMGQPDFRIGGHIFATLASEKEGYGNLMLTPEHQAGFVADAPRIFLPIHGGWAAWAPRTSSSPPRTKRRSTIPVQTAYKLRVQKNSATAKTNIRRKPQK